MLPSKFFDIPPCFHNRIHIQTNHYITASSFVARYGAFQSNKYHFYKFTVKFYLFRGALKSETKRRKIQKMVTNILAKLTVSLKHFATKDLYSSFTYVCFRLYWTLRQPLACHSCFIISVCINTCFLTNKVTQVKMFEGLYYCV